MEIGIAATSELEGILEVLNAATKKLLDKKVEQWKYPWETVPIEADIREKLQYSVKSGNRTIAVFSVKDISCNPWEPEGCDNQCYLYRIAVHPDVQGTGVGEAIWAWVKAYAEHENKTVYLDCWAGNEKLKAFYSKAGFTHLGEFPEEDYQISVFRYKSN